MRTNLAFIGIFILLALTSWHCGSSTGTGGGLDSADIPEEDPIPALPLYFAGWVDTLTTPVFLELELRGEDIEGTVTYAKVGKPIALTGHVKDDHFELQENIGGKVTGDWSFYPSEENPEEYTGQWRKSKGATASLPLELHPLQPLNLSDAILQKRYAGSYGGMETISWPESDDQGNDIQVEEQGENSLSMTYIGARHFTFTLVTTTHHGYGCMADGYMVMVAPDTAMFWGLEGVDLRFVFRQEEVSCQALGWSPYYCGAAGSLDADLSKN